MEAVTFEEIQTKEDFDRVLKTTTLKPLLIQFTAPWCRRCSTLKVEIKEAFNANDFRWVTIDVDEIEELRERFNVVSMPRLDIHMGGIRTELAGFEATIPKLREAIETGKQKENRVFVTDEDF
jgi:thioredoxin-like negative regulator of GroEL